VREPSPRGIQGGCMPPLARSGRRGAHPVGCPLGVTSTPLKPGRGQDRPHFAVGCIGLRCEWMASTHTPLRPCRARPVASSRSATAKPAVRPSARACLLGPAHGPLRRNPPPTIRAPGAGGRSPRRNHRGRTPGPAGGRRDKPQNFVALGDSSRPGQQAGGQPDTPRASPMPLLDLILDRRPPAARRTSHRKFLLAAIAEREASTPPLSAANPDALRASAPPRKAPPQSRDISHSTSPSRF